jgi:molecular chaperone DnaK
VKNFVGIDLGTTNSAICSFDGEGVRLWKSPEQNDVTPSVIFYDKRGNKYIGSRAYNSAPHNPKNTARLFKRMMGSNTPIKLEAPGLKLTPEECSAEILKTLYAYLPEEIRNDPGTGTVVTVPAAFNQMQKDSTLQAVEMANIGNVALMQEPVAAVMSVMQKNKSEGIFLVYDLGGGTLDISIAQSISGNVNLLAHGGIEMCGGRDFDRRLVDNFVYPWLHSNFDLPDNFVAMPKYSSLTRIVDWATEKAKINLSSQDEANISLSEGETRVQDEGGNEIYLDINITRESLNQIIEDKIKDSINVSKETLEKAGLTIHDIERIVFVGGPTHYKPLRELVTSELAIPGSTELNPMTAVAEGAAIFAESVDWGSASRGRKSSKGSMSVSGNMDVSFNYIARTPDTKSKVMVKVNSGTTEGVEFQIDSADTGWTSGKIKLGNGVKVELLLLKSGDNIFKVFMFDPSGNPISLKTDQITIVRTAATIAGIPASHSIGIEVLEKIGGRPILDWLIRSGEPLPKKGKKIFKASETLRAGGSGSINFKLWEGEIEDPAEENLFIGPLKISGADFDDGVIAAGSELVFEYEIHDSGNVTFEVSIPSIGSSFHSGHNFYSRLDGQVDFTKAADHVVEAANSTLEKLESIEKHVSSNELDEAREKLQGALSVKSGESDPEVTKQAMDSIQEAKRKLSVVRQENLKMIWGIELEVVEEFFNNNVREHSRPSEEESFDALLRTAKDSIKHGDKEFENQVADLRGKNYEILWRQDWFALEVFKSYASKSELFCDAARFDELVLIGKEAMKADDISRLKEIVGQMEMIKIYSYNESDLLEAANIIRG